MSGPENPYAFPAPDDDRPSDGYGMTLRDWFAGQAITGFVSAGKPSPLPGPAELAEYSYVLADAMLAERAKS